jgi:hypothetical protein
MSLEGYGFLTLKDKTGTWRPPRELVFPREYSPDHSLEELVSRGLLDKPPLHFVATDFVDDSDSEQVVRSWRRFLEELDVEGALRTDDDGSIKKGIVQRIGVLAAKEYERRKSRSAKEWGESEAKLEGYDIVSYAEDNTVARYIEAKGGSGTSFDWWLSVHEVGVMHSQDKADRYYIYGVSDALSAPTVYVVKGTSIPADEVKMSVPPKTWQKLAEDTCEL